MAYQSFVDQQGDSLSDKKLAAIRLPSDLSGKSVLDIGCNEGFFCQAALDNGAQRVLGIDTNAPLLTKARARVPNATFEARSWWDLPAEKFDLILFLSAIHYEADQKGLLDYLSFHLKPGGLLILEGGIVHDWARAEWTIVQRHDGIVKFPTARLLQDHLLARYASRLIGASVQQSGDPMTRFVVHAVPRTPTIMAIGGASRSGKSNMARLLGRSGAPVWHLDNLLGELFHNPKGLRGEFIDYTKANFVNRNVSEFVHRMSDEGKFGGFAELLLKMVSKDDDLTIIEGYPMSFAGMRTEFEQRAMTAGYRVAFLELPGGIQDAGFLRSR